MPADETDIFDLAVIGAGPAGIAACLRATAMGLQTLLLDDRPAPGGQIYRDVERATAEGRTGDLGKDYGSGLSLIQKLRGSPVIYWPGSNVWQIEHGFILYLSRGGKALRVRARAVVLAVGAMERPVPIAGWTLPGVMTAGAAQLLLKSSAVVPPQPIVIAGQGPLPLLYATQLIRAGVRPAAILDTTPTGALRRAAPHLAEALANGRYLLKGLAYMAAIRRARIPMFSGVSSVAAFGTEKIEAVHFTSGGVAKQLKAGALLLHEGVVSHTHMSSALGLRHRWNDALAAPEPELDSFGESSLEGLFVAGDGGGIGGAALAEITGALAALGVAARLGRASAADAAELAAPLRRQAQAHTRIRPFLNAWFVPRADVLHPPDDVIVCRCEEITAGAIRAAVADSCLGPNQVKAFTRCGMGPCQGRQCALTLLHVVAQARGLPPDRVEGLSVRPPLKPLTLGELASLAASEATASR